MSQPFSRNVLKMVIAQICQTIGWNGIHNTPFEIMVDVLQRYLSEIGKLTHLYSEQFGRTEPNLDDIGLAFRDMNIQIPELEEYIKNVTPVPCAFEVPRYPVQRESHLNFLKPGSREVVTRPVHVHEHLPPMHPEMEEEEYGNKQTPLSIDTAVASGSTSPLESPKGNVFKRPGDPISSESPAVKRARLMLEEEGRPLREISSVMMTTSGFLSPAREGKLPESRTPLQSSDSQSNSPPQTTSYPMVPPEVKGDKKMKKIPLKKTPDGVKVVDKENNKKKEHKGKELVKVEKQIPTDDTKVKKLVSMKELTKLKALKSGALKMMAHASTVAGPSTSTKAMKPSPPKMLSNKTPNPSTPKMSKPAAQPKVPKVEKCSPLPITVPQPKLPSIEKCKEPGIVKGKLSAEPDKQKLNIFKKISKVKEEKPEKLDRLEHFEPPPRDSRESSPGLVIDESEVINRQREVRMAQIDDCIESVIQRSMEIANEEAKQEKERKSPPQAAETSTSKVDESINDVVLGHVSGPGSDHDIYGFDDDFSPPGTPSTPRTPELPMPSKKMPDQKEKKKKRDKSKSKKEGKGKSAKSSIGAKKIKLNLPEPGIPERPKTPEVPDRREQTLPVPVFPFFPHFPPAPGLIPPPIGHPLFPRFPMPLGKNLPHPAMPNLPMPPPLFMQPRSEEMPEAKEKPVAEKPSTVVTPSFPSVVLKTEKQDKPLLPMPPVKKKSGEKKVKEHKKKEKDKTKKRKDKKEKIKGKEKGEKKKIKVQKKDKGKGKDKKEKKIKRKEKEAAAAAAAAAAAMVASTTAPTTAIPSVSFTASDTGSRTTAVPATTVSSTSTIAPAVVLPPLPVPSQPATIKHEDKGEPGVPKITFRLGPASPRPPTPDAQPRKIVIKPVVKNQDGGSEGPPVADIKREPSPELARISALITRPPKQKSASKTAQPKQEPEAIPSTTISILPPATPQFSSAAVPISSTGPSSSLTKPKKSSTKPVQKVKGKDVIKKVGMPSEMDQAKEPVPFYYDDKGNKIWICPECGGQDNGSPMIGCDDCDAWYHWVCVGIQVPPDENEDWYCRVCIVKKQESIADKKKKSRKKKVMT